MKPVLLVGGIGGLLLLALASAGGGSGSAPATRRAPDRPLAPGWERRVILRVARNEGRFDSVNPDDGGGIAFGIFQWNQRTGDLGVLLQEMQRAAPRRFAQLFGEYGGELLRVTSASAEADRLVAVGGARLSEAVWVERFRAAGREEVFQRVQLDLARRGVHFKGAVEAAEIVGLKTERALALFLDTAVQQGAGAAGRVARAVARSGKSGEAALVAFAEGSAERLRRRTAPTGEPARGLRWRAVGGEWRLFAGATDLFALVLRRREAILSAAYGAEA